MTALAVIEAREWIGTPYVIGQDVKGVGCDCLGLLRGVWRVVIGEEPDEKPRTARDWYIMEPNALIDIADRYMTRVDGPVHGGLVIMNVGRSRAGNHCGLMALDGDQATVIHADNAPSRGLNRVVETLASSALHRPVGFWSFE